MHSSIREFWQSQIGTEHSVTRIESVLTGIGTEGEQKSVLFEINNSEKGINCMREFSLGSNSRKFIYLLSAVKFLLAAYTGDNCITVGCPLPKYLDSTGNNFIFLKNENVYYSSFCDICNINLAVYEKSIEHIGIILPEIFNVSNNENSIFDIVVSFDNLHEENRVTCKHGLEFSFKEDSNLSCKIIYDTNRYEKKMINYIGSHLAEVFDFISEKTDVSPNDFIFPNAHGNIGASRNVELINQTSIQSILIRVAEENSESIAVVYRDSTISYYELNKQSNCVANWLSTNGIVCGDVVGIICESPINIIIILLAALKVGATFIILDYMLPRKRLDQVISDCAISILISDINESTLHREHFQIAEVLRTEVYDFYPKLMSGDTYAYIVYTSGSTGTPKGIRIKSKSLLNFVLWRNDAYSISNKDVILQTLTPSSFDGYLISVFTAMVSGATLVCMDKEERADFGYLDKIFCKYSVTNMSTNPAFVASVISGGYLSIFKNFKTIIMGGQHIDAFIVNGINTQFPHIKLFNEYGPSECCMGVASHKIISVEDRHVVGNAIDNTFIYVLNKKGKILPSSFIGEICIGGICLAEGYINSLETTKDKFVFHQQSGAMIYHSGDYGYFLDNNELVFYGRNDKLVKVNGYRIDLSEIENALIIIEGIERAIVEATNNSCLDAYIVISKDNMTINLNEIYDQLIDVLPIYMIPNRFYQIPQIFHNESGKYDMEEIKNHSTEIHKDLSKNTNSANVERLNELLVPICQMVLGTEDIGINDNFFELGGNSLSAIRVIAELEEKDIVVEDIEAFFKYQTIQELSLYLDSQQK